MSYLNPQTEDEINKYVAEHVHGKLFEFALTGGAFIAGLIIGLVLGSA